MAYLDGLSAVKALMTQIRVCEVHLGHAQSRPLPPPDPPTVPFELLGLHFLI